MILITTGTVHFPFTRLINFCLNYFTNEKNEKIIIQNPVFHTNSTISKHIKIKKIIKTNQITDLYKKANLIISASGEGTILQLLEYSKNKPILFPRNPHYKEHVDDQQLKIAKEMQKHGLCITAFNTRQLKQILDNKIVYPNSLNGYKAQPPLSLINFLHKISS